MTLLQKVVPPNLPIAQDGYIRLEEEFFRNVLRLYFNQLSNLVNNLGGIDGGKYIQFPYGAFHQDGTTTLTTGITNEIGRAHV